MANDEFGERSHEATPHRREMAREEGQVVVSRDLAAALSLLAAALTLWYLGGNCVRMFGILLREQLHGEPWWQLDSQELTAQMIRIGGLVGWALLPILGAILLAGVVVNVGQVGFLFLPQKLALDFNRVNPFNNFSRVFSMSGLVHSFFGMGKTALVLAVAGFSLWGDRIQIMSLSASEPQTMATTIASIVIWTIVKMAAALAILALVDYGYQYWKHEQDLRMTTQELKQELKEQQGDPQLVARRKQVQRQLVMNRLTTIVPKADAIVTNPTEYAIALQYDPEKMEAPVVLAKGAGVLAQQIRRLGLKHSIPIVERKELARYLYANVEVNHAVPAEQYAAVAEVIRYVYKLKGKRLPGAA
jgi:flagellar biosynthetic protein FlhB